MSLLALGISYFFVAWLRRWAVRRQIMDVPNIRSSHTYPVPRGGGLAIVAVTLSGIGVSYIIWEIELSLVQLLTYTIGAVVIAFISWLDDLSPLSPTTRLVAQCLGAGLVVWGMCREVESMQNSDIWIFIFAFFWIIWLTNAYNFMDGIDGIAAGQAVVAGVGWAIIGETNGIFWINLFGVLLAASSLGFLGHNWPPARIFMGDVGSAFLGYTFAVMSLWGAIIKSDLFIMGILLMWPFVFDTLFTLLRRLCHRENVLIAHRSHLYQRLITENYSHKQVSALYIGLGIIGGTLAIGIDSKWPWAVIICFIWVPLVALGLWGMVFYEEQKSSKRLSGSH